MNEQTITERKTVRVEVQMTRDELAAILAVANPDPGEIVEMLTRTGDTTYAVRHGVSGLVQSILATYAGQARQDPGAAPRYVTDRHRELVTRAFGFAATGPPNYGEPSRDEMVIAGELFATWLARPEVRAKRYDAPAGSVRVNRYRRVSFHGNGVMIVYPVGWDCDGFAEGELGRWRDALSEALTGTEWAASQMWNGQPGTESGSVSTTRR